MILIEPVPYLFKKLKTNYASKTLDNNIQFLNIAVSNKNDSLTLYVPSPENDFSKFPYWASQLASTNKDHIVKHNIFSSNIVNLKIDEIKVPCFTLNNLIEHMNILSIDKLLIDTEGHDYEILMDFDLSVLKPKVIRFENRHMDGVISRGKRYEYLLNHLTSYGYKKIFEDQMDTEVELQNN
jgi:FkbM family methyltransferase